MDCNDYWTGLQCVLAWFAAPIKGIAIELQLLLRGIAISVLHVAMIVVYGLQSALRELLLYCNYYCGVLQLFLRGFAIIIYGDYNVHHTGLHYVLWGLQLHCNDYWGGLQCLLRDLQWLFMGVQSL